jgi:alpha-glucosidase
MDRPEPPPVPWWRRAVVYQVYIRSFADSNGDGTGDLNGLRSRLGYLRDLGVDAIWVNPWYPSPLADGGYDVADYRGIDPRYGTLAEAEALIADAHQHGIRVIADLVPNHTSDRHAWFVEAVAAPPGHPSRDRYHIRDGGGPGGDRPPTNWVSSFGGPAWTRLPDGQWYLHLFAPEQPDLNWEHPEVRAEFESVLRFWLDLGIDGFRVDVAHSLVKDPAFPDLTSTVQLLDRARQPNHPFWDRDGIHEIVRGWRAVFDQYADRMMVAEAWVQPERLPLYLRPGEYHQAFNFEFLEAEWDAAGLRQVIDHAIEATAGLGSTPTWVLSNHDVVREATRYGLPPGTSWRALPSGGPPELLDAEAGLRRARAAALLMLGLPGSVYLYQGEELGLPEVLDLPVEVLDDPVWERSGRTRRGRDGCRVPIPWDASEPAAGFSSSPPWLPQPETWPRLSVAAQAGDPASPLELYRAALRLRSELATLDDELHWLPSEAGCLAYRRGSGLTCVVNFGPGPAPLPEHDEVLLISDQLPAPDILGRDTAAWLR